MDQGSIEEQFRIKLTGSKKKTPDTVWAQVSASLNEQQVAYYQRSQYRLRWLTLAAVLLAFFSFALHINFGYSGKDDSTGSFNALLSPLDQDFTFDAASASLPSFHRYAPSIVFVTGAPKNDEGMPDNVLPTFAATDLLAKDYEELSALDKRTPKILFAQAENEEVNTYLVSQYRSSSSLRQAYEPTFWAGVEVGAGNFNPDFSGLDALAIDPNFETIASNLAQSPFVNPSSIASQNGMERGVMTSLGVDFGLRVGQRWTLESGVQYARMDNASSAALDITDVYTINNTNILDGDSFDGEAVFTSSARGTMVSERIDHNLELENSLRFTSVPLKAGYFIVDRRVSLRVNAGVTANYFLSNRLTDPTGQLQGTSGSANYNQWSFDGLTGFELGYYMTENVNLTIEPNYIQSITPLSQSLTSRSGFLVQTGIRYHLQ